MNNDDGEGQGKYLDLANRALEVQGNGINGPDMMSLSVMRSAGDPIL